MLTQAFLPPFSLKTLGRADTWEAPTLFHDESRRGTAEDRSR